MLLFMDGFDHYGDGDTSSIVGASRLTDGVYATAQQTTIGAPPWGARTGRSLMCSLAAELRKVLDVAETELYIGFAMSVATLPNSEGTTRPLMFKDSSNAPMFTMDLDAIGTLSVYDWRSPHNNDPIKIFQTQTPVIVASNWHFVEVGIDTVGGTFRIDVDGVTVLNASGGLAGNIQNVSLGVNNTGVASGRDTWFDDFTIRNGDGTRNNGFQGDLRIATLFPNADGPNQGWTPEYLHKIGNGILDMGVPINQTFPQVLWCPSSTATDLGAGDFTLETFVRFNTTPSGSDLAHIFGKWDEANNRRSWQLYLGGPTLNNGNIVFRTSTDGSAATVVEKISFPWPLGTPDLNTWYNIALCRTAGELFLFIDGNQYGLPIADSDTYFAGPEVLSIGAQMNGGGIIQHTGLDAYLDETRLTVGVGRYSANYSVTTVAYPRSAPSDPDFADVVLLMGYDAGIADESSYHRTVTPIGPPRAITPDDGAFAFQTIDKHSPYDGTFIEAALLPATQTMTLSGNPADGETATVGHYTSGGSQVAVYTFNTVLGGAFSVLIGATVGDTLNNLAAAINHGGGIGTQYGTGTIVNDDVSALGLPAPQMLVQALAAGAVGNAITCTDTISGGGWDGATLAGGQDIPGNSDFYFDRPPPNTTTVKAVEIMNRSFKSDAGPATVQVTFVGPLGGTLDGADNPLTVSPSYRWDIFETDPDTGAGITPSTIIGGRVRINRTE